MDVEQGADMEKHEAYLLQGGLLVLVKMPLSISTDALKGIPLPLRDNSLRG